MNIIFTDYNNFSNELVLHIYEDDNCRNARLQRRFERCENFLPIYKNPEKHKVVIQEDLQKVEDNIGHDICDNRDRIILLDKFIKVEKEPLFIQNRQVTNDITFPHSYKDGNGFIVLSGLIRPNDTDITVDKKHVPKYDVNFPVYDYTVSTVPIRLTVKTSGTILISNFSNIVSLDGIRYKI